MTDRFTPSTDYMFALVGKTPLVPLTRMFRGAGVEVFAKLEYYNPSGSVKDRIVAHMLRDAISRDVLSEGCTVVEATSGNTGSSLALFCARLGYRLILTIPKKTSAEKKAYMRILGAEIVECPDVPHGSRDHYQTAAKRIAEGIQGAFLLNQYESMQNVEAHYLTTGPEIFDQMKEKIDWFVAGGSTGGTITGVASFLKEVDTHVRVLLADPFGSVLHDYVSTGAKKLGKKSESRIEGAGKDFLPSIMNLRQIDLSMRYSDEEAFEMCRICAQLEGILPGLSGGGNLAGVKWLLQQLRGPARIVTVFPDAGTKYLSKFS